MFEELGDSFYYRNARCTHQDQSQVYAGYRNGRGTLQDQLNFGVNHFQQTSYHSPFRLVLLPLLGTAVITASTYDYEPPSLLRCRPLSLTALRTTRCEFAHPIPYAAYNS